ncbi:hypothetical protein BGZ60DRAFT_414866 [Tricladium varicosporioides]|nr:hypothetical protein BGZ60DRAFT_414866 [Hymenoscyphus varicosporioides]
MAILQFVKGNELAGVAAVGQMVPDGIFHFVGVVLALKAENGQTVPVAYGEYRGAVLVGVAFFLLHVLLLVGIVGLHVKGLGENVPGGKYKVFISLGGRGFVLLLGVFGIIGSMVIMVVARKMCGNVTSFFGLVCQAVQLAFTALWAFYRVAKQNR